MTTEKISTRELWRKDIICSTQFSDLLPEAFNDAGSLPLPKIRLGKQDPPVFLYQESRGNDNYVNTFTYYGGKGESAQTALGARSELKLGKYIFTKERGEILDFFCKIEFCLEVLVCVSQGVFDGKVEYRKIQRQFDEENGSFSTTQRKVNYLEDLQILSTKTTRLLKRAKQVRNVLGHQYLPQRNIGLTDEEVALYDSVGEAIGCIYTAAWFYLLDDYVGQQDQVLRWLIKKQ